MTAEELIAGLWRAEPAAFARLLQNCRFEGFGGSAYGGETIREAFRPHARDGSQVQVVAAHVGAAAFGVDAQGRPAALVADLHQGWVTRLWRLGEARGADPGATFVSVPADLDLDQRGGRLAFSAAEHPELAPAAAAQVSALGDGWLFEPPAALAGRLSRVRPIILRAFSQEGRTAVLARFEGASGVGLAGAYAAALLNGPESHTLVDSAGLEATLAAGWTPRLR